MPERPDVVGPGVCEEALDLREQEGVSGATSTHEGFALRGVSLECIR